MDLALTALLTSLIKSELFLRGQIIPYNQNREPEGTLDMAEWDALVKEGAW